MSRNQMRKGIVCGILCVFLGTGLLPSLQGDFVTPRHAPQDVQTTPVFNEENSMICGYVNDSVTGDPLENIDVEQYWQDTQGNYGYNFTHTDVDGFYMFHTAAVSFRLYFFSSDYFREYTPMMSIGENEIFWYNVSLIPVPPITVHFTGFITDSATGQPLEHACVSLNWYDTEGHYWYNYTYSNASGYYYIGMIPGETYMYVSLDNYFEYDSPEFLTMNNSLIWWNVSLFPYPSPCAMICGYVTDNQNGDPLPDAGVSLYSNTEHGQWSNQTATDQTGFFTIGSIQGIVSVSVWKSSYSSAWIGNLEISENEICWVNISLEYQPTETSGIQGYLVDAGTYAAIPHAYVRYDWRDDIGHFFSQYTFTDQKGYYSISAPEGHLQFLFTGNGYSNQYMNWFEIGAYAIRWLNTSLSPEIKVEFLQPQSGVYFHNQLMHPKLAKLILRFFPDKKPVIIGPVDIIVNVTNATMGCNRVAFYIDGKYWGSDSEPPFTCYWKKIGFFTHEIRAIAYDNAGPCASTSILVRKVL
jgi:protocatechuate 3,4-dioxygenase beta subunit